MSKDNIIKLIQPTNVLWVSCKAAILRFGRSTPSPSISTQTTMRAPRVSASAGPAGGPGVVCSDAGTIACRHCHNARQFGLWLLGVIGALGCTSRYKHSRATF